MRLFKNSVSIRYSILIFAPLLSACHRPEAQENESKVPASFVSLQQVANEKYVLDKKESRVTWKGSMQFVPKNAHIGYAYISNGELKVEKGQLVGGTVEVDMNTIADKDHGSDNNLVDHLKSPDFFDTKKFPSSVFIITRVESANSESINVTGNLVIKGITHEVTFPVTIEVNAGIFKANGKLTIDRTKWDIRYNSGKFYKSLADETISDDIELDLKIVATKK
jgi:polyisoprenoid-binding protein YceI